MDYKVFVRIFGVYRSPRGVPALLHGTVCGWPASRPPLEAEAE